MISSDPKKTKILSSVPVIENSTVVFHEYIRIKKESLRFANGHAHNYYTLDMQNNAAVILAQTTDGKFVLNEEYRHPTKRFLLSCPGGFLADNESPELGAQRELLEETGFTAEDFKILGKAYPFPGLCSQCIYYVTALNAKKKAEPKLDSTEVIRTVLLSANDIKQEIKAGKDVDGIFCAALYFFDSQ